MIKSTIKWKLSSVKILKTLNISSNSTKCSLVQKNLMCLGSRQTSDDVFEYKDVIAMTIKKWNFNNPLKRICKIVSKKLNVLFKVSLNVNQKTFILNSFIEGQFDYCQVTWMFFSWKSNTVINQIHKRAFLAVRPWVYSKYFFRSIIQQKHWVLNKFWNSVFKKYIFVQINQHFIVYLLKKKLTVIHFFIYIFCSLRCNIKDETNSLPTEVKEVFTNAKFFIKWLTQNEFWQNVLKKFWGFCTPHSATGFCSVPPPDPKLCFIACISCSFFYKLNLLYKIQVEL